MQEVASMILFRRLLYSLSCIMLFSITALIDCRCPMRLLQVKLSDALASGETFAFVCTSNDDNGSNEVMALAPAITFANIGSKAIVLFLAIDERYRESGFGSQLLMLTGQCLMHCGQRQQNCIFLLANQQSNMKAWTFYTRCGFQISPEGLFRSIHEFFSTPLSDIFLS
jgi:GNAT superfamily N-acetyltransferase